MALDLLKIKPGESLAHLSQMSQKVLLYPMTCLTTNDIFLLMKMSEEIEALF